MFFISYHGSALSFLGSKCVCAYRVTTATVTGASLTKKVFQFTIFERKLQTKTFGQFICTLRTLSSFVDISGKAL